MIFYEKVSYLCCENSFFVAGNICGFCFCVGRGKLCKTDLSSYDGIFYSSPVFWESVTWEQKNVSMIEKNEGWFKFLKSAFFISWLFFINMYSSPY